MARTKTHSLEKDAEKLDGQRVKSEAYTAMIIKEQEDIIEAANHGIEQANSDLRALKTRLEKYVGDNPEGLDERGVDLKYRYTRRLQERNALEKARVIAEESIVAAKLHMLPGELSREDKAPCEKGYHGVEIK
jgi:hypothetical protein